jgi:tellurium resistance protein TerZ
MTISLEKGSRIDLTKTNTGLSKLHIGLGWDPAKNGGILGGLFGGSSVGNIDLDASAILLDANKAVVDIVYFGRRSSAGVQHSGDNLTGHGDGDDEVINVDLQRVDPRVDSIVFTINSFRGQTFESIANAKCRILNGLTNQVLATYNLSSQGRHTAIVVGSLYRHGTEWKFRAIGELAQGRTAHDLQSLAQQLG